MWLILYNLQKKIAFKCGYILAKKKLGDINLSSSVSFSFSSQFSSFSLSLDEEKEGQMAFSYFDNVLETNDRYLNRQSMSFNSYFSMMMFLSKKYYFNEMFRFFILCLQQHNS